MIPLSRLIITLRSPPRLCATCPLLDPTTMLIATATPLSHTLSHARLPPQPPSSESAPLGGTLARTCHRSTSTAVVCQRGRPRRRPFLPPLFFSSHTPRPFPNQTELQLKATTAVGSHPACHLVGALHHPQLPHPPWSSATSCPRSSRPRPAAQHPTSSLPAFLEHRPNLRLSTSGGTLPH